MGVGGQPFLLKDIVHTFGYQHLESVVFFILKHIQKSGFVKYIKGCFFF